MNINDFEIWLTNFLMNIGYWGYILSCILLFMEAFIPILPATIFITLLIYKFGYILGFIISYIFSIVGSIVVYNLFKNKLSDKFNNYIIKKDKKKLNKVVSRIRNIKFVNLCLIIALPFTPQFLIHISSGLVNMDKKKYLLSLLIGKIFLIIFWGFIGTSLLNSIKNPINIIYICLLLGACFIISKLVSRKEGLE